MIRSVLSNSFGIIDVQYHFSALASRLESKIPDASISALDCGIAGDNSSEVSHDSLKRLVRALILEGAVTHITVQRTKNTETASIGAR